jgi:peptidoglycan/LPS O-acetylase OafA/YrhL
VSERVASLDALRGIAAFAVAIPHFAMYAYGAGAVAETVSILGVEIFFVLSGYVLAPQILTFCFERPSCRNYGVFLIRRWMRTVPPYAIALILTSAGAHQLFSADFFRYLFYVQNLTGQHNTMDYFSIAWSLSVEEWFYLTFPLLCLAVASISRSRAAPICAGLLFVGIITAARTVWGDDAHWGSNVRRVVCFRVDAIAWGFLLHILVRRSLSVERLPITAVVVGFCVTAGATLFATYQIALGSVSSMEHAFPFYAPALGGAAILLALRLEEAIERWPALSAAGLFLGRLSYSVYLFHLLALGAIIPLTSHLPTGLSLAAFLLLTGMIASLMAVAVEAPILAARPPFKK